MRCKFTIISVVIMICLFAANVYADEQMNVEVDKSTCNIKVSGTLGTEFSNKRVILHCLSENDDRVISSDDDAQQETDLFKIFRQSTTNGNGEYSFDNLKINLTNGGNYVFYLTIENSTKRIVSGSQYIPSINEVRTFLQNVSSKNEDLIYAALEEEASSHKLGVSLPLYEMLNDAGRKNVRALVKENTYAVISDVEKILVDYSIEECLINIKDLKDIDKILFPGDYSEFRSLESVIEEKNGYSTYKNNNDKITAILEKLSKSEKNKIYEKIDSLTIEDTDDFYDGLSISVILYEMGNVTGYGDVAGILEKYSSTTLKDMDYSKYLSCKYKNEINEDLLKKSFTSVKELCDYINTAIDTYNKKENGGGSAGGSSQGGYSGSFELGVNTNIKPTSPPTKTEPVFGDIIGFDWAKEAIENLYNKGIVSGTGDGSFRPERDVTREEFIKMLLLTMEYDVQDGNCGFEDVPSDAWYSSYVYSAVKNGIVSGVSANQFGTGLPITREDVAVLIWRACQGQEVNVENFSDGDDVSNYAKEAVMWLKESKIVSGYDDGTFRPKNLITRAETAKILWTLYNIKQQF